MNPTLCSIFACALYIHQNFGYFEDFLSDLDEDPGGGDFNVETESGGSHQLHVHSVPVHIDKLHNALHGLGEREREGEREKRERERGGGGGRVRSEVARKQRVEIFCSPFQLCLFPKIDRLKTVVGVQLL